MTTWEKPAELEDDDAELRAALAASAAQPPPVDEDAELRAALALSAQERPPAPPAMDDDAELRAVLALSAREASQQPVRDDELERALAASLQETRRPIPTDISSVLAAAGLSRHLPLFRREEIESVEDLRYLSVEDFVAIGLERTEAQDLSRMCATVAV